MGRAATDVTKIGAALLVGAALITYALHGYLDDRSNDQRSRHVEIVYSFMVEDIPPEADNMRIWVPKPPSNLHQQLHSIDISPQRPYVLVSEPEYGNEFILFDIDAAELVDSDDLALNIFFTVTRDAIVPRYRHEKGADFASDDLGRYLQPDRLVPVDGKVAREARAAVGNVKEPLRQVRRLYDHIVATLSYDKSGVGWGRGDALYACDLRRGNCTDFHSLLIGQARSLDIPARFIMGLPLPAHETEGKIAGYHCWGEFHLTGKGWFPVDASEASKFPERKEDYFAQLDADRVAFSVGRDIKVPASQSPPLNYAIYPHVEIDGQVHQNVKTGFHFRDVQSPISVR